ncbi:MAG: arginine--tRNA ligase [Candidatus Saccharibacteria bacterium]
MKHELSAHIASTCHELFDVKVSPDITRPDEQFGDFATNIALQLSKELGQKPLVLAEKIIAKLTHDAIESSSIAGPGFINIKLTDKALVSLTKEAPAQSLKNQVILAEYSDPNPFKPLHAGHLYTTLVGDMIARLTEVAGAKTTRINYGGDVGLHVAKSMWAILSELKDESLTKLEAIPVADRASWLGARYVEGNNAYEDDSVAKAEITDLNKRVYVIHNDNDHTSPFAQIYWTCRTWSFDYFATLYAGLQVTPFDRYLPESEVTPLGLKTVREQLAKGVYEESKGAIIFDGEVKGLHTRVFINSEGLPTYETKEVGLSLTKWQDYSFDQSIIITANEQQEYMKVVLASISEYAPELSSRTKHLVHGVVKLQGGVKMSSRKGNIVSALDILEAAREAGKATGTNPSEDTILAAVKYAFAKNRIGSDIAYDPTESVALEGNSGPYLQYAHARARSIIAKSTLKPAALAKLQAGERSLLRKIGEYSSVVDRSVSELMPHHICTYLYELAQIFNRFYEANRVIGDEREALRLHLMTSYADTLEAGLSLLGITAPHSM